MPDPIQTRHAASDHLRAAWGTWIGRLREVNQDVAEACPEEEFLVVSDGMGRACPGEAAARMVARRLPHLAAYHLHVQTAAGKPEESGVRRALKDAVMELNHALRHEISDMPGAARAGATVVGAWARGDALWIVHMGDSRAYLARAGQAGAELLTRDHSVVKAMLRNGMATEEDDTALLEHRGKLTRYVGIGGGAGADVTRTTFAPGDRLLLCTDGLTSVLTDRRIATLLRDPDTPTDACRALLQTARDLGALDNTTALVAECVKQGVRTS